MDTIFFIRKIVLLSFPPSPFKLHRLYLRTRCIFCVNIVLMMFTDCDRPYVYWSRHWITLTWTTNLLIIWWPSISTINLTLGAVRFFVKCSQYVYIYIQWLRNAWCWCGAPDAEWLFKYYIYIHTKLFVNITSRLRSAIWFMYLADKFINMYPSMWVCMIDVFFNQIRIVESYNNNINSNNIPFAL